MAVKYSCDRCGSDEQVETVELPLKKKFDLCRNCLRQLLLWIQTSPNQE